MTEVPEYQTRRSHSQLTAYEECPRRYRHYRVDSAPEHAAWWSVGGTAVHGAIEAAETAHLGVEDAVSTFYTTLAVAVEMEERDHGLRATWRAAGSGNPDRTTEGEAWWWANGPEMVRTYYATRDPDRHLIASELEFRASVTDHDGESGARTTLFYGFIDQLWLRLSSGEYEIDDLKTGARMPAIGQVAEYAYALELGGAPKLGGPLRVSRVGYNNARTGKQREWRDWRTAYPYEPFARRLNDMNLDELAGLYPAKPSWLCRSCGAWDACQGVGGIGLGSTVDTQPPA